MTVSRREFVGGLLAYGAMAGLGAAPARAGAKDPSRAYRACVIGNTKRGGYGHGLDVCFQKVPGVDVVAVADPDPAGRAEAQKKAGAAKGYADWREMLKQEWPQLVSIGPRWVDDRAPMVITAAEAGIHIYMEKPLAASLDIADAILKAASSREVKIAMALHALMSPGIVHLKKLVAEGLIGDLLEIRTRGKEDSRAGGEDLMVLGTHCLYLMRFFAGEPLWCSARVTQDGREITASDARSASEPLGPVAGDSIQASYAFPGGVQGYFASQKCRQGPGGRFQIALHGSKGVAVAHIGMDPEIWYLPDPLWSPGKSGARWQPLPGAPSGPDPSGLSGQDAANHRIVVDLLEAIESKREPVASGQVGRATLEMILAVYASHLQGRRVTFPLADRRHPLGGPG
jgi:predicted dehydrogenase